LARISFTSSVTGTFFRDRSDRQTTQTTSVTLISTGTNNGGLTAASGQITLVTPTYVNALGNQLFAAFTIHLLPEPGTLLLLGSGIAALAWRVRRG
jgi:hypothetical protein